MILTSLLHLMSHLFKLEMVTVNCLTASQQLRLKRKALFVVSRNAVR